METNKIQHIEKDKFILDACCGGRMFWFNKNHPNTIYIDNRTKNKGHCEGKPNHEVNPDMIMDFRKLEFKDNTFKVVIFDPPHVFAPEEDTCIMTKCYGRLNKETWQDDIKRGFDECMRVLDYYGLLVFKWNECGVKIKDLLEVIKVEPLLRDMRRGLSKSHWMLFMKIPKLNNGNDGIPPSPKGKGILPTII
jgi:hypothetical protein